ncbi:hypothetical protein BIV57_00845 [Mangrovactinospora gilvigrisea]|uniref:Uncharacterized protein n=2 Tax=Mangrovactinospora gilvigrisea TaxID=1428644 RepID=A0A1J7CCZ0_9ACTN|nr:hypothetical protein [Mangrovactinospora gilvigrisea]OIV39420.1 hypothetical protein BIV57_00845 [Mangrovactinospora gilvigrisea]
MGDGVHSGLGAINRIRSTLVRRKDHTGLMALARFSKSVKAAARLEAVRWEDDGTLAVDATARLAVGPDREPLPLLRVDDRLIIDPAVTGSFLPAGEHVDVTDELTHFTTSLSLRNRETGVEWHCLWGSSPELVPLPGRNRYHLVARGTGRLVHLTGDQPTLLDRGFWDVWIPLKGLGASRKARLGSDRAPAVDPLCLPMLPAIGRHPVIPYFTDTHSNLTLDVGRRGKRLTTQLVGRDVSVLPGPRPELRLPIAAPCTGTPFPAKVLLDRESGEQITVDVQLRARTGRAHLPLAALTHIPAGTWRLSLSLDDSPALAAELCELIAGRRARIGPGRVRRADLRTTAAVTRERGRPLVTKHLEPLSRCIHWIFRRAAASKTDHG